MIVLELLQRVSEQCCEIPPSIVVHPSLLQHDFHRQPIEAPDFNFITSDIGDLISLLALDQRHHSLWDEISPYVRALQSLDLEQTQQSRTFPNNTSTPASPPDRFFKYPTIPPAQQTNYSIPLPTKDGQTPHPSNSTTAIAPS